MLSPEFHRPVDFSHLPVQPRPKPAARKWLRCLGCGKELFTTAGRRFCSACTRRNQVAARRNVLPRARFVRS